MATATAVHKFTAAHTDGPGLCSCGAAYVEGFNLHHVKVAHLASFMSEADAAAQLVADMRPGEVSDIIEGHLRFGFSTVSDLALWNAAIDRDNGYTD